VLYSYCSYSALLYATPGQRGGLPSLIAMDPEPAWHPLIVPLIDTGDVTVFPRRLWGKSAAPAADPWLHSAGWLLHTSTGRLRSRLGASAKWHARCTTDPWWGRRWAGRCRRRAEKQSGGGSPALDTVAGRGRRGSRHVVA